MKINKEYFIVFTLLLVIICTVFSDLIFGAKILASSDTLSPIAIKNGINLSYSKYLVYPLWTPWIFSGLPTIHSLLNVSYSYYPHKIITFLIDILQLPWIWNFIFHFIFGGLGMYKLLKYLRVSKFSSLIVASSFMIMPYMIVMMVHGHGSQMMTACFIPWVILFLFRLVKKWSLFDFSILALLVGLQLQRGHIQIAYYTWMMIGLYLLINIINNFMYDNKGYIQIFKKYLLIFTSLLIGIGISLNLYYPVLNYSIFSTRGAENGGIGILNATQWSFSVPEIITLIIPSFFGFGGRLYWGGMPFTDYPNYAGILLVIFAIYGLLRAKINHLIKIFFILVLIFSGLLSLGKNFMGFYTLFYNYLPFFDKFRSPVFILIIFNFSLYILSAYGIDAFIKKKKEDLHSNFFYYLTALTSLLLVVTYFSYHLFIPNKIQNNESALLILEKLVMLDLFFLFSVLSILIFCTYLFSRYKINHKYFYFVIAILCLIDFMRIDKEIINPKNHIPNKTVIKDKSYIDKFLFKDETVEFLLKDDSNYRIFDLVGEQNRWSIFNIENIRGYHPAKLNIYNRLITYIEKTGYNIWPSGILQLLNVKYIILPESNFEHPLFEKLNSKSMYYFGYSEKYDGNYIKVNIFENKNHLPRLFYTRKLENIKSLNIYDKLFEDSFNPEKISYIDDNQLKQSYSFKNDNPIIQIDKVTPNKIYFSTNVQSEQFLLFSEIFFPYGWTLSDGEKEHSIYKVNDLVRGAFIPPGKNNFVMEFSPNDLFFSKILSITLTLLMLFVIVATYIKRNKDA